MEFSRQEYWSELPFPPPGDLSSSRIEPMSPAWTHGFFTAESPGKPYAVNMEVCISHGISVFISFQYIPRGGIVELYGGLILVFE